MAIEAYLATVTSRHGAHLIVKDEQGKRRDCISAKKFSQVVCGDLVRCTAVNQDRDQLIEVLPRKNELARRTEYADKVIAANIDTMVIVSAIQPEPSLDLIDHYIVAAENLSANAIIVINKSDLTNAEQSTQKIQNKYLKLPYPCIQTSTFVKKGLNELLECLQNQTCIFVGQSGVGKSSLINALIPTLKIETQEISENIQQGKHTTSATTLYDLPLGGELIDSPGVREFSLPKLDKGKIMKGFCEINAIATECKYNDCIHIKEPACAVRQAVEENTINAERYASYKNMMQEYL